MPSGIYQHKKHSEETKKKIGQKNSFLMKEFWKDNNHRELARKAHLGQTPWNKGLKGVQISPNKGNKLPRGENSPNWKGGRKESRRRFYLKNRIKILEDSKQYRIDNKKLIFERWKSWCMRNPEKLKFYWKQRSYRRKNAIGKHTKKEWEELKHKNNYRCLKCNLKEPFNQNYKWLTEDHIIPLIKGGTNYITNIQPLCYSCNSKKGTQL